MKTQGRTELTQILDWLCENWDRPEEGIGETRGGRQHFTFGRFLFRVAFDRAIWMARPERKGEGFK